MATLANRNNPEVIVIIPNMREFRTFYSDIEEFVGIQNKVLSAVILACGLREGDKLSNAYQQVEREQNELDKLTSKANSTGTNHDTETTQPAEREAVRLSKAKKELGGLYAHGLDELIRRGAEGFRKDGKCYIYLDSIPNIRRGSARVRHEREGYVSLKRAASRAGITYQQAKDACESNGWPLVVFCNDQYMKETDCARLVLKFKI